MDIPRLPIKSWAQRGRKEGKYSKKKKKSRKKKNSLAGERFRTRPCILDVCSFGFTRFGGWGGGGVHIKHTGVWDKWGRGDQQREKGDKKKVT